MRRRRWIKPFVVIVLVALFLPFVQIATGGRESSEAARGTESRCDVLADRLADALGAFISGFSGVDVLRAEQLPPLPSIPDLRTDSVGVRDRLRAEGCDLRAAAEDVQERSASRPAEGLLANTVRRTVVANVVNVLEGGEEDPDPAPSTRLQPGDDLGKVVSGLPAGSVLRIPAGEIRVDEPIVLLQDVSLVGEGADRTRIISTARGAGVVLTAPGVVAVEGLTLAHEGDSPASLLLVRAGRMNLDDVHLTGASSGGRLPSQRPNNSLIVGSGIVLDGGDELSVTDSLISDNEVSGVQVSGTARTVMNDVTVTGSGTCGLCFLGESSGTVMSSLIRDNGVGVLLADRAAPTLEKTRISGNTRAGVVTQNRSHPVLRDVDLTNNGPQGLAVLGNASPRLIDSMVAGHSESGVALNVGRSTSPQIRGNTFGANGKAAMVFLGEGTAKVSNNRCSSGRSQIVLDGSTAPVLSENRCSVRDQR